MSGNVLEVSAADTTAPELIDRLDEGDRVVLEISKLGIKTDVTLRKREGTYYCDTPIKLLTYDSREGMQTCLERLGVSDE